MLQGYYMDGKNRKLQNKQQQENKEMKKRNITIIGGRIVDKVGKKKGTRGQPLPLRNRKSEVGPKKEKMRKKKIDDTKEIKDAEYDNEDTTYRPNRNRSRSGSKHEQIAAFEKDEEAKKTVSANSFTDSKLADENIKFKTNSFSLRNGVKVSTLGTKHTGGITELARKQIKDLEAKIRKGNVTLITEMPTNLKPEEMARYSLDQKADEVQNMLVRIASQLTNWRDGLGDDNTVQRMRKALKLYLKKEDTIDKVKNNLKEKQITMMAVDVRKKTRDTSGSYVVTENLSVRSEKDAEMRFSELEKEKVRNQTEKFLKFMDANEENDAIEAAEYLKNELGVQRKTKETGDSIQNLIAAAQTYIYNLASQLTKKERNAINNVVIEQLDSQLQWIDGAEKRAVSAYKASMEKYNAMEQQMLASPTADELQRQLARIDQVQDNELYSSGLPDRVTPQTLAQVKQELQGKFNIARQYLDLERKGDLEDASGKAKVRAQVSAAIDSLVNMSLLTAATMASKDPKKQVVIAFGAEHTAMLNAYYAKLASSH